MLQSLSAWKGLGSQIVPLSALTTLPNQPGDRQVDPKGQGQSLSAEVTAVCLSCRSRTTKKTRITATSFLTWKMSGMQVREANSGARGRKNECVVVVGSGGARAGKGGAGGEGVR